MFLSGEVDQKLESRKLVNWKMNVGSRATAEKIYGEARVISIDDARSDGLALYSVRGVRVRVGG
jgi:hypothetical protein